MFCKKKGQSALEYTLIIATIVAALVSAYGYLQKSILGKLRVSSDQVGDQFDPEHFSITRETIGGERY